MLRKERTKGQRVESRMMYATYNKRAALVVQLMQLDRRALCFVLAESRARYS